jgi:hypothetical protein
LNKRDEANESNRIINVKINRAKEMLFGHKKKWTQKRSVTDVKIEKADETVENEAAQIERKHVQHPAKHVLRWYVATWLLARQQTQTKGRTKDEQSVVKRSSVHEMNIFAGNAI